ncbi:hypothetical protein [Micromonospora sp. NPDC126480]|uniref:hypothetical protein n=1 Tax=Micromonospora sp. NPDC126480 TaxID=3155312 RepID=UPI0033315277
MNIYESYDMLLAKRWLCSSWAPGRIRRRGGMPGRTGGEPRALISELLDVDSLDQTDLDTLSGIRLHRSLRRLVDETGGRPADFLWFDNVSGLVPQGADRPSRSEDAGGAGGDGRPERR